MFSKLLKYELKFVGKWYFALNASIIAIPIFLGFSIKTLTDYAENYATSNDNHYTQHQSSYQSCLVLWLPVLGLLH